MTNIVNLDKTRRHHVLFLIGLLFLLPVLGWIPAYGEEENFLLREDGRERGSQDAPVTLLEYSDFTCGFCVKFFQETWPRIFTDYVQTGKVRLVYRDFPRTMTGPALDLAIASRCAGEQGQYWPMHDRLFHSQVHPDLNQLSREAKNFGLNTQEFSECVQSQRYITPIFQDRQEGGSLGVRGTPGFILFITDQVEDGPILFIPGAFPFDVFQEQIDRLLLKASEHSPPNPSSQGAHLSQQQPQFPS
ncbi:MAG: thioredoxin domain-containing protein [Nitrospirales bacterium]|nr:thioredoxin domain-containing protein [Nitrospirales bacterium]